MILIVLLLVFYRPSSETGLTGAKLAGLMIAFVDLDCDRDLNGSATLDLKWKDPAARKDGGALGTFKKGDMMPELETSILAMKPGESSPWVSLAWSLRQEGNWRLADKCYEMAFAAEPTDAQLLWDRAQHLEQQAQISEGRALKKRLADSEWQPRFAGLKAQARQAIEGR